MTNNAEGRIYIDEFPLLFQFIKKMYRYLISEANYTSTVFAEMHTWIAENPRLWSDFQLQPWFRFPELKTCHLTHGTLETIRLLTLIAPKLTSLRIDQLSIRHRDQLYKFEPLHLKKLTLGIAETIVPENLTALLQACPQLRELHLFSANCEYPSRFQGVTREYILDGYARMRLSNLEVLRKLSLDSLVLESFYFDQEHKEACWQVILDCSRQLKSWKFTPHSSMTVDQTELQKSGTLSCITRSKRNGLERNLVSQTS